MLKKIVGVFLVLVLMVSLTGCGRHRGSGNPAAPGAKTSKLLSASIQMPKVQLGLSIRAAIKASALTTEALTDAEVEVSLADGSALPLEKDPNTPGLYNLYDTAGYTLTYPFVIEAKKGGILIQNIITDSSETKTHITCDHTTTAFTQAALITAQMDNNGATLQDVISAGSSLSFDLAGLKEMFTQDSTNLTIERILEKVVETLTNASIEEKEVKVADLADLQLEIKNIAPTITDEDIRAAITTVVNDFVELFKKANNNKAGLEGSIENLYTKEEMDILSEDFILSGYHKETFLSDFQVMLAMVEDFDELGSVDEITKINYNINLRSLAEDLYLVHLDGTINFINQENKNKSYNFNSKEQGYICNQSTFDTFEHFYLTALHSELSYFPVMVRKEGASWKVIGNQVRAQIAALIIGRGYQVDMLGTELVHKDAYNEIQRFGVNGSRDFSLTIEAENKIVDSYWYDLHITPKVGHTYKFEAEFDDGDGNSTTQTYTHKIQSLYPLNENIFTIKRAGNEVTITWPQAKANDFLFYYWEQAEIIGTSEEREFVCIGDINPDDYSIKDYTDINNNFVTIKLDEGYTQEQVTGVHIRLDIATKSGVINRINYWKEFINE